MSFDFDRLALIGISRNFGRRSALVRVSFEVRAGETIGLLGPNGAGKSTLLAIIATLLAASEGEVRYGEATARGIGPALRRRIGWLGHDLQLYPELTPRENLEFFARLYGLRDAAARAARALADARLSERADDTVSSLSRGMKQRVALERALLHEPRLLLLDEPFTGLDQDAAASLSARLERLRPHTMVIVATHDLDLAEPLVDRCVMMRGGRAEALEGPGSLRDRYHAAVRQPLRARANGL